jgi:hypothetical protein
MPTNRQRRTRARTAWGGGVTEIDYLYYTYGDFFEAEGYTDGKSKAELLSFWQKHREAIMQRYMSELQARGPLSAGVRPSYYWAEIKKPRLKTGTRQHGRPWPDRNLYVEDVYETDLQYLRRLNLLQDWELEAKK